MPVYKESEYLHGRRNPIRDPHRYIRHTYVMLGVFIGGALFAAGILVGMIVQATR